MPKTPRIPSYRLHKPTGQARVIIAGQHHYLGKYGSAISREKYGRLIAEHSAIGSIGLAKVVGLPLLGSPELTIVELVVAYWKFAELHYRKDGKPTEELNNMRHAVRHLKALYGRTAASDFGPRELKVVRQAMIDSGLSRGVVNSRVNRIRRVFRWAVSEGLVPPSLYHGLQSVSGLQRGRTEARETAPILPVGDDVVDATLPFLTPVVADMVRFQRLVGCRPSEVCIVRPCDLDRSDDVWVYRPGSHKSEHHERERTIFIGPKAQDVLRPYLLRPAESYCFSPAESEAKRLAVLREKRKTKVQPSQQNRRQRSRKSPPRDKYDRHSYRQAVARACVRANRAAHEVGRKVEPDTVLVPTWRPNQLRHARGTEVRKAFGLEAAQVSLGHARADVTQVYAERDMEKAAEVARQIG